MRTEAPAIEPVRSRGRTGRWWVYLTVAAATALVVGANAHLLYAALGSQPDCVTHLKVGHGQPGAFRAADPAC